MSECTLVKMPHCWKSHVTAQIIYIYPCPFKIQNGQFQIYSINMPEKIHQNEKCIYDTVDVCVGIIYVHLDKAYYILKRCKGCSVIMFMHGPRGGIGGLDPLENDKLYGL